MSKTTLYNPRIPYLAHIPGGFSPGKMIKVTGFAPHLSQKFMIDIQCGPGVKPRDDIALHIMVRFNDKCIVRNHLQGTSWGVEDNYGGIPISTGKPFNITILCEENTFKLFIHEKFFCEFPHRLLTRLASHIAIAGDVTLTMLQFSGRNRGNRSFISVAEPSAPPLELLSASNENLLVDESKKSKVRNNSIVITVTEPRILGEGLSTYVIYRVVTRSNMAMFPKHVSSVTRRFSDFLSLHEFLEEKYLKQGIIVPPAPEKSVLGNTKVIISNRFDQNKDVTCLDFVMRRQEALERYINRTAQHPVLRIDPNFRRFLTADITLARSSSITTLATTGFITFFNTLRPIELLYKTDENGYWLEKRYEEIAALDEALKKMSIASEAFSDGHRKLGALAETFSETAGSLSKSEENSQLKFSLFHLKNSQKKVADMNSKQSFGDINILNEVIKDYHRYIDVIREVYNERVKIFQNLQEMKLKHKTTTNDDVDNENENDEINIIQNKYNEISNTITEEMNTFETIRTKEFDTMIRKYLKNQMSRQKQIVNCLKFIVPEHGFNNRTSHTYPKYKPASENTNQQSETEPSIN